MSKLKSYRLIHVAPLLCVVFGGQVAGAQPVVPAVDASHRTTTSSPFLLDPPKDDGPVVVHADFELHNINDIDVEAQTFEFTGVLTFKWLDKRQAFDPAAEGVYEKVYQGNFQFNEISPGWFPQEILVNKSGFYEKDAVVLRALPDGTQTLIQTVNAVSKSEFNMRRFPFDRHRLTAVFEVLGFDDGEVKLQVIHESSNSPADKVHVPQWNIEGISLSNRNRSASYAGHRGAAAALVVSVEAKRKPLFILRLVVGPLTMIVLLSFSVFWMDRSSVGDRINVSFVGILTSVAYQLVMSDILPHISYTTLINAFLSISFITMCATVVINLIVGALDKKQMFERGDLIDRRCRWLFPIVYFSLLLLAAGVMFMLSASA